MARDEQEHPPSSSPPLAGSKRSRVVIDDGSWPLLRVRFPTEIDLDDIENHFDELQTYLEREEEFAIIVDIASLRSQSKEQRQAVADRMTKLQAKAARYIIGVAHVTDHWLSRTVLTLVYWLSPPPFPIQTFRSDALAESWAKERLSRNSSNGTNGN